MTQATRDMIKSMLGIQSVVTTHDVVIDGLIDVADQIVLDDLGLSSFGITNYYETHSFEYETRQLAVRKTPLVSVVALTMSDALMVENTDYYVDKDVGFIELKSGMFDIGMKKVAITYEAGFDPVPSDITYACNLVAVSLFNQQSHLGFKDEKAGDYSYSMDNGEGSYIPHMAKRILNKYRQLFAKGMKIS